MIRTICILTALILSLNIAMHAQRDQPTGKIPWKLTVIVMDNINQREKAEIPVREAVEFIEKHTRFKFEVDYVSAPGLHGYTPYKVQPDPRRKRFDTVYAMMGWNVPPSIINSLPVSTSYLFLYRLYGRKPAQAGSALGLDFGLKKGGKPRTYATVPVDQWWYNNRPAQGFRNAAAQVLTHEIINTIQGKLEAKPYRCGLLTGVSKLASLYEAERLEKISDACYQRLGQNE